MLRFRVLVLGLVGLGLNSFSQSFEQTLSLDSGFVPPQYSNRALWNLGLELDGVTHRSLDWFGRSSIGNNPVSRSLFGAALYWLYRYPQYSFFVTNHEFGHGTRFTSVGSKPVFAWSDDNVEVPTIFQFYMRGLSRYGEGAYTSGSFQPARVPRNWDVALSAGGVNNSASYAEAVEDAVTRGRAGFLSYIGYVRGKTDTADYVNTTLALRDAGQATGGGDMELMEEYYDAQGFGVSLKSLRDASNLSRWVSSTHWLLIWSGLRYVVNGSSRVVDPFLGPWRLPDLSHFLTLSGPSYKIRTGFRFGSAVIPVEIESVYKGRSVMELKVGFEKYDPDYASTSWIVSAWINSKSGLGVGAQSEYPLAPGFLISAGASWLSMKLLEAERNSVDVNSSNSYSSELWARVSWIY